LTTRTKAGYKKNPFAQVAQSVEQRIENPRVGGSIPSLGTIFFALVAQLDRATDYESVGQEFESLQARQQFKDLREIVSPFLLLKSLHRVNIGSVASKYFSYKS
jgi:hypothetical protein